MEQKSRRTFIGYGARAMAAAVTAGALLPGVRGKGGTSRQTSTLSEGNKTMEVPFEIVSSANPPWKSVRVLDSERMPWEPLPSQPEIEDQSTGIVREMKTLFENKETGDHLLIIQAPPGAPGGTTHYHTFHEWAYRLMGDFTNNEYTSPDQRKGILMQFREGWFLDRPAYSLHGGEKGRKESQIGQQVLIMEEGGGNIGVIPGETWYSEEYKKVKKWNVPRLIDTIGMLPWEPIESVPGLHIKRLADDQTRGFRVIMWWLQAGRESSQLSRWGRPFYYKQAYQFNFVLTGDLKIQAYREPGQKAEQITLGKYFYLERPPMSIFGLADHMVTERGCVWLETTYAKGTSVSETPIEEPNYV
jgi:hypothetical protein